MSRCKKPRKAYRPRPVVANTMGLVLHNVAKPAPADRAEVLRVLHFAHKAMREGVATEFQWSILAGAVDVSKAIERQGIVRGLGEHLASAEAALQGIYNRAMHTGSWRPTALYYQELDHIQTFVDLHEFQINQLGRQEFLAAIDQAQRSVINQGHTVTVANDLERLAA